MEVLNYHAKDDTNVITMYWMMIDMKQPLSACRSEVLKCLINLFFLSLRLIPEEVSMIEESYLCCCTGAYF